MGIINLAAAKIAKVAAAEPLTKSARSFPALAVVIEAIRSAWPKKTAAHVAHFTGTSERTVKFWLACETRMSVDAIAALLRTSEGYAILEAIMTDCKEEWWLTTRNAHELTRTRRQIADAQKRLNAIKAGQAQIDLFQQ